MRQFKVLATALAAALLVAACGGGGDGDQTAPVKYSNVVSFGDSLSDAGTYNVGPIKASGGGMFTVNGIAGAIGSNPVPSENWAQLVSASVVGKASCAARIGGFGVAETAVAGCTNYAQGGARVTDPNGIGNASGGAVAAGGVNAGALTEPVVTQIANYIKDSGGFTGNELITVLAGPNDLFMQITKLTADATAAGNAAAGAAFVGSVTTALVSGAGAAPAAAATAIQTAMGTAMATAAAAPGATTTTIFTAGGNAGVAAAAAAGNTAVMNVAGITAFATTAQGLANTAFGNTLVGGLVAGLAPANQATAVPTISAAVATAGALATATSASIVTAAATAAATDAAAHSYVNPNLANAAVIGNAAATAGSTAFVTSMVGSLTTGTGAAPAGTAPAIQTAMGSAITAAAAAPGATNTSIFTAATNAAVMTAAGAGNTAVMNMAFIGGVMTAAGTAAGTAGPAAGNQYAATTGKDNAGVGVVTAAATLAGYVKDMVNKGAKHVVVLNLPDMSLTPSARETIVYNADGSVKDNSSQQLVLGLVNAFNAELQKDLGVTLGVPANGVLLVDFFTNMQNNVNDPGHYALTNTKDVACNLTAPANVLATAGHDDGSSLVCNASNLIAGDTSHYMFADKVHPTPYSHKLLSQVVNKSLIQAGWL